MGTRISQLPPKGANLANTDLLMISKTITGGYESKSITGAEIIASAQTGMQTELISGTNIKTVNSTSLLGSGNVAVQPTLVSGTNIKTINGNSLLGSGDLVISTGLTIGTTAIASGTIGRILFEGTGNVVQESANLFWDNTNSRLGIGTATPNMSLDVRTGNVGIGVTSDAGFKLDVNGTARVTGQVNIIDSPATSGNGLSMFGGTFTVANSGGYRVLNFTNGAITVTGGNNFIVSNNSTISLYSSASTSPIRLGNSLAHIEVTNNNGVDKITIKPSLFRGNTPQYLDIVSNDATVTYGQRSGSIRIFAGEQASTNGYGYIVLAHNGSAQRGTVAIGTSTTHASAILDVTSTTQGFLPPRMTNAQMVAIATPASGLMVYDTTNNKMCVYDGTAWQNLY